MAALNGSGVRVELKTGAMQVVFDMNSLIEAEERYGSLDAYYAALSVKPLGAIRFALWVAGEWLGDPADKPNSEKAVGAVMDSRSLEKVTTPIAASLREALGMPEGEPEQEPARPTKAARSTRSKR